MSLNRDCTVLPILLLGILVPKNKQTKTKIDMDKG